MENIVLDERGLQNQLVAHLNDQGFECQEYVPCSVGIADVVIDSALIEVKHWVDRSSLFKAVGQALLYREAINKNLDAKVICSSLYIEELRAMASAATQAGIEVIFWEPEFPLAFELGKKIEVLNTYKVGDICTVSSLCCSGLLKYNKCWTVVSETYDYGCTVQLWDGKVTLGTQHLKKLILPIEQAQQILEVSDAALGGLPLRARIAALARCNLEPTAWCILETLNRQTCFTQFQLDLLAWVEEWYGIRTYDN